MSFKGTADNVQQLVEAPIENPVSHIYKIKTETLQDIFVKEDNLAIIEDRLNSEDGVEGVIMKLATNANTGIIGDEKDLVRRKRVFGENIKPIPPRASILESIVQTLKNIMWVAIGFTAILSSVVSVFLLEWKAVWEGVSIIVVAVALVFLISVTDYIKDSKYIELSNNIKEENVPVVRGKLGATQSISIWDVVVGDVVLLETGASVPADSLIIEAEDLQIDEPFDEDQVTDPLEIR